MNASPLLPTSPVAPFLFPAPSTDPSCADKSDWQLIGDRLPLIDPDCEFYTLRDIAPLLGSVTPVQLSDHAKDLFRPRCEGNYRLDREQALRLIKRYCLVGRRRFGRMDLERLWREWNQKRPILN